MSLLPSGQQPPPRTSEPVRHPQAEDAERQTRSLAALAFALALLIAGLFLVHTLRRGAAVEDCLMAGRINCDRLIER